MSDNPLSTRQPLLLVRARIDRSAFPEFIRWYHAILRPHILAIPGIAQAHAVVSQGENAQWLRLYEFAGEGEIQAALDSAEARRVHDDWEQWSEHVQDLSIEVYAPLSAAVLLHHWN